MFSIKEDNLNFKKNNSKYKNIVQNELCDSNGFDNEKSLDALHTSRSTVGRKGLTNGNGTRNANFEFQASKASVGMRNNKNNGLTKKAMTYSSSIDMIKRKKTQKREWTVIATIIVVFLLFIVPIFVYFESNGKEKEIIIDGKFKDWKNEIIYDDKYRDCDYPSVDIIKYGISEDNTHLSFYLQTRTKMYNDVIQILIDTDRNRNTGYSIIGIGADYLIEIYGKTNKVISSKYYQFDNERSKNDWNAWEEMFEVSAKYKENEMEAQIWLDDLNILKEQKIYVYFHIFEPNGAKKFYEDYSDTVISNQAGAIIVEQQNIGAKILSHGISPFLKLKIKAVKEDIKINSITFERFGTAKDSEIRKIIIQSTDIKPSKEVFGIFNNKKVRLNTNYKIFKDETKTFYVLLDIPENVYSNNTIGMRIYSIDVNKGAVTIHYSPNKFSYIFGVENKIVIDGGFEDWKKYVLNSDKNEEIDNNIDIREYKAIGKASNKNSILASFYLKVNGTMMAGTNIPTYKTFYGEKEEELIWGEKDKQEIAEKEILPANTGEDKALIFLDIDKNASTGYNIDEMFGAEYMIRVKGRYSMLSTEFYGFFGNEMRKIDNNKPIAECDATQLELQIEISIDSFVLMKGINIYFKMLNWKAEEDYSDNMTTITKKNLTFKTRSDDGLIRETKVVKEKEFFKTKSHAHSVCLCDVDNDNDIEIITGGWAYQGSDYKGQIGIWTWDGKNELKCENLVNLSTSSTSRIYSIYTKDLDGDNKKEIVTGGIVYNPENSVFNALLQIWNRDGKTLKKEDEKIWGLNLNDRKTESRIESIILDDVDSDGKIEIISVGYVDDGTIKNGQLGIWNYSGNINNEKLINQNTDSKDTYFHCVNVGNIDKDDKKEIVIGGRVKKDVEKAQLRVLNWYDNKLTIKGTAEWSNVTSSSNGDSRVRSVYIDDLNKDNRVEIVSGGWGKDNSNRKNAQLVIWNFEGSTLRWKSAINWVGDTGNTEITTVFVSDYDKDGKKEIITGGYSNKSNIVNAQIGIFTWNGENIENKTDLINWNEGGYTIIFSVIVGDVDRDGTIEIVTVGSADDANMESRGQQTIWSIPEFSEIVFPIFGIIAIFAIFKKKKLKKEEY